MLFMAKTLESSGRQGLNTITRLTVTDGKVKVQLHDETGSPVGDELEFEVDTDILIGGNDSDSCIIEEITGIDPATFPEVTIEFFMDIATESGKMVITMNDLEDELEQGDHNITFMYGDSVFATQVVAHKGKIVEPALIPTEKGHWDADLNLEVTTDTMIYWVAE